MLKHSKHRNPRQRRLARGADMKAKADRYTADPPLWCFSCGHEITGKRHEEMQCHNCQEWNRVVAGKGFPAHFNEK